jgi:hypothetical protein
MKISVDLLSIDLTTLFNELWEQVENTVLKPNLKL